MKTIQERTKSIKNELGALISCPKQLRNVNPLLIGAKRNFLLNYKKYGNTHQSQITTSEDFFSISVSKKCLNRSLIFLNTLIKGFKARGHKIVVRTNQKYSNYNGTKAIVYEQVYPIRLRESSIKIPKKDNYNWTTYDYEPTGKLVFVLDDLFRKEWTDSKTVKIEDKLANIIAYFELKALEDIEKKKYHEARRKEEELARIQREEQEKAIALEQAKLEALIKQVQQHTLANQIRSFLKHKELQIKDLPLNKEKIELQSYLEWGYKKADELDSI